MFWRLIKIVRFDELLKEIRKDKIFNFPLRLYGQAFAQNKKTGKPARVTIALPENIVGEDLKDLDKWAFVIFAIDKKEWDKAWKKLET